MARVRKFNQDDFLVEVQQVLNSQLNTNFNVDKLAHYMDMNVATLRRLFNDFTEHTPKSYLAHHRITLAKTLLLKGEEMESVVKGASFSEHKVFSTVFKRYEGITPSEFIRGHLNSN
jgi:AraC-like DNA-binding protein